MKLYRLDQPERSKSFSCGDDDLDEFYRADSISAAKELLCVTYAFLDDDEITCAFFSVSNDSIKKEDFSRSRYKKILHPVPFQKRYSSMPAVKIGRLGVDKNSQRKNFGSQILDYIKVWFKINNKTGCRFITVDAYNNRETIKFYKKNDFEFLDNSQDSVNSKTRIMFYDLINYDVQSVIDNPED